MADTIGGDAWRSLHQQVREALNQRNAVERQRDAAERQCDVLVAALLEIRQRHTLGSGSLGVDGEIADRALAAVGKGRDDAKKVETPQEDDMDDDTLLDYALIHARTGLALFHQNHVRRICELAGERCTDNLPQFISMHADVIDPLVTKARVRRTR